MEWVAPHRQVDDVQLAGAQLMARFDRFGLFDQMGIGKTAATVRAADMAQCRHILVVCPASVRQEWVQTFKDFQCCLRSVVKINSEKEMSAWLHDRFDVGVLSYAMITRLAPMIETMADIHDAIVLDEAHYLKNPSSQRSQIILGRDADGIGGVVGWFKWGWWVTGTPVPNDVMDIWTFLRFTRVMPWRMYKFADYYFTSVLTKYSQKYSLNPSRAKELRTLISSVSVCRTYEEAGIEIPPLTQEIIELSTDLTPLIEFMKEHPLLDAVIHKALEEEFSLEQLEKTTEAVASLRRLIGEIKAIPYARQLWRELQKKEEKKLVFGYHSNALMIVKDYLSACGVGVVSILGRDNENDRIAAIRAFTTDPSTRVFIGSISAAGTGINLQSQCSNVDMFETDWTPANNIQSIQRVLRRGQENEVHVRFITINHWIDKNIQETNRKKIENILSLGFKSIKLS